MASSSLFACFAVSLLAFLPISLCVTYSVGGSEGWIIPSSDSKIRSYEQWAASEAFHVGDLLVFKYPAELHSVLEVTEEAYKSCSISNPLYASSNGNSQIKLSRAGVHYFICGVPGHCTAGQKLQITVTKARTAVDDSLAVEEALAPAPASDSAPPADSSAPSLSVVLMTLASFSAMVFAFVFAL